MKVQFKEIVLSILGLLSAGVTISQIIESGNSSLIIALFIFTLIVISYSVFSWYKRTLLSEQCKKVGIKRIIQRKHTTDRTNEKMTKKLENSSETRIFATTWLTPFLVNYEAIRLSINNGAKVRVLTADRNSQFLSDLEELEIKANQKIKEENVRGETDRVTALATRLNNTKANSSMGSIEVAHFQTEFRMTMVLTKNSCGDKWGWITPTLPPAKSLDSISFEIESKNHEDDNIYNMCITHFDAVWEKISKQNNSA